MNGISRIFFTAFFAVWFFLQGSFSFSQELITIRGAVKDTTGLPVENAAVTISGYTTGTYTDSKGFFSINIPRDGREHQINISMTGYKPESIVTVCDMDVNIGEIILTEKTTDLSQVTVTGRIKTTAAGEIKLSPKEFSFIPSASGSFETILKTLPGVSSNNELSSGYSVRGGNFDENLVYVNDIEIFRPFLIRSGQQEGLSFINPDLVSSVTFSSGGFSSVYGDKMSSVLDITYKRPSENRGSVSGGLLVSSAHYEGSCLGGKITWLSGIRYKSSRLMLKTLEAKGNYQPVFADVQNMVTIKTGKRSELSLFGSYSSNTYNYIPTSRESKFGNETEAYRLYVLFEGREKDRYEAWNSALTWNYSGLGSMHKFILSYFGTGERESFDIRGYYSLNTLDKNSGSENFTDTTMNIGIGSFLSHARNNINAGILSACYKGESWKENLTFRWGLKIKNETINDNIREWKMVDSAGFSIPYHTSNGLILNSLIKGENSIDRLIGELYGEIQGIIKTRYKKIILTGGTRTVYNSFTSEIFACPRISAKVETPEKISVWIASGAYYQMPFYREMRFPDGRLNSNINTQKSFHTLTGMSYDFIAWERPFRFTAELFNKILRNIIPYRLDNVRIIYEGDNLASGYSRGIDLRLNGEFVSGAESWFSLSLMDSRLRIPEFIEGMCPSPSDQTINLNIFFQDYLPNYPSYRAHINISYITGMPVISPFNNRYDQYHRLPAYRRVDLGMNKVFSNPFTGIKELIAGIEIYNLLDINNTVSYFWIKTVNNQSGRSRQFAIPDYLTGRSLNFRLSAVF